MILHPGTIYQAEGMMPHHRGAVHSFIAIVVTSSKEAGHALVCSRAGHAAPLIDAICLNVTNPLFQPSK